MTEAITPLQPQRPWLDGLNESQLLAVTADNGPVLILAGAGTGKTRVLTTRIVHMLAEGRAMPWQLCAVTFTNKAAREMRERIEHMLGQAAEGLWLGTFHAIALRILRRHAELVGLTPQFTIIDMDDQIRLMKQLLQAANIDEKRWPAKVLSGIIQRWKDKGWTPKAVPTEDVGDFARGQAIELYEQYQQRLRTLNACDFGDLLLHNLTIFREKDDILAEWQRRFRGILVDEYQDTNVAQYLWLRLLAQQHRNITCVGDDDQSIYSWRGAEVTNILRFDKDFEQAQIVRLERNYRSTGHILGAASGVIALNSERHGKTLYTDDDLGERVRIVGLWDDQDEARHIGEEIEAHQRAGGQLSDVGVLVRAGFQTRPFEERFIAIGLPYRVIGGLRFYERQEIRDAIAYLRLAHAPEDDLAFERIVNLPRRGIGAATVQKVLQTARGQDISAMLASEGLVQTDEITGRGRKSLASFVQMIHRFREQRDEMSPREFCEMVLDETGYTAMWQADKSPDATGRLENLKELARALDEFDTLAAFLEHISLVMDNADDSNVDQVAIMTLHGAKGLEFDTVFLAGWEEGLFPSQRSLDEGGNAALEEERRLAYVGITRARRILSITFAANRRIYGNWASAIPSRFVDELPPEHIEHAQRKFNEQYQPRGWHGIERQYGQEGRTFDLGGRTRSKGRIIEGTAQVLTVSAAAAPKYTAGERVFHQKFGYGEVLEVEGNKLDIAFEKAGRKRVVDQFVKRQHEV